MITHDYSLSINCFPICLSQLYLFQHQVVLFQVINSSVVCLSCSFLYNPSFFTRFSKTIVYRFLHIHLSPSLSHSCSHCFGVLPSLLSASQVSKHLQHFGLSSNQMQLVYVSKVYMFYSCSYLCYLSPLTSLAPRQSSPSARRNQLWSQQY